MQTKALYVVVERLARAARQWLDGAITFPGQSHAVATVLLGVLGIAAPANAGSVETRDGKRHEGTVRLDGGRVIVKTTAGPEVTMELSAVRHATFIDQSNSKGNPDKPAANEKPADKPRPKRLEGLRAEYYAGYDLKDLRLVRIDPKLETWWPLEGSPDPSVPKEFSARWTGQIEPKYTETYLFQAGFDSGGRLWIDNRLLLDHWKESGTFSTKIDFQAGRKYDLKMEFKKGQWGGNVRLYWSSAHQGQEAVPSQAFTPPPGTVPPLVSISSPATGDVKLNAMPIMLEATASDLDGKVRKVEFYANGASVGVAESEPWRVEWKNSTRGYHKVTAKATDDAGISTLSEVAFVSVAGNANGALPQPWLEMPVGKIETLGSTNYSSGTITLNTTRGDLWGEQDSFHYVFQPLLGDGTLSARLASLEPAKAEGVAAGLLIRENLGVERAKVIFLGPVAQDGIQFSRRENIWEDRKFTPSDDGGPPCYLKLARYDKRVLAYRSNDGVKWNLIGQRNIELPRNAFIGLAIVSPEGENAKAVFDHVTVTAGSPKMESTIKGLTLRSGTIVAGNVHFVDDTSVKMWSAYGETIIPTSLVARILIRPLTHEAIEQLQPGRTGAILNNGDFYDGTVAFKDGSVRVTSVLFGVRRFNTWDETVAAILNDVEEAACKYEVRCRDGSVFRGKSVEVDANRLKIAEASGANFTVPGAEVTAIRSAD